MFPPLACDGALVVEILAAANKLDSAPPNSELWVVVGLPNTEVWDALELPNTDV